jgi:hypothetical protein
MEAVAAEQLAQISQRIAGREFFCRGGLSRPGDCSWILHRGGPAVLDLVNQAWRSSDKTVAADLLIADNAFQQ